MTRITFMRVTCQRNDGLRNSCFPIGRASVSHLAGAHVAKECNALVILDQFTELRYFFRLPKKSSSGKKKLRSKLTVLPLLSDSASPDVRHNVSLNFNLRR